MAPLGAVSLIFNALLARLILGDRFGKRTVAGTALVAGGATLIAVFGVVQEEEHGIEELLRLWARPAFLAFFGTVCGVTGTVLVIVSASVEYARYRPGILGMLALTLRPMSRRTSHTDLCDYKKEEYGCRKTTTTTIPRYPQLPHRYSLPTIPHPQHTLAYLSK